MAVIISGARRGLPMKRVSVLISSNDTSARAACTSWTCSSQVVWCRNSTSISEHIRRWSALRPWLMEPYFPIFPTWRQSSVRDSRRFWYNVAGILMKRIAILGSTGSIGRNALRVVDAMPGRFRVVGLAAHSNGDLLFRQALRYKPAMVSLFEPAASEDLKDRAHGGRHLRSGVEGLVEMAGASRTWTWS